jgi:hypothetical protein
MNDAVARLLYDKTVVRLSSGEVLRRNDLATYGARIEAALDRGALTSEEVGRVLQDAKALRAALQPRIRHIRRTGFTRLALCLMAALLVLAGTISLGRNLYEFAVELRKFPLIGGGLFAAWSLVSIALWLVLPWAAFLGSARLLDKGLLLILTDEDFLDPVSGMNAFDADGSLRGTEARLRAGVSSREESERAEAKSVRT